TSAAAFRFQGGRIRIPVAENRWGRGESLLRKVPRSVQQIAHRHELEALRLRLRDLVGQDGERGRMRVADRDRGAALSGEVEEAGELGADGFRRLGSVEEHLALRRGDPEL